MKEIPKKGGNRKKEKLFIFLILFIIILLPFESYSQFNLRGLILIPSYDKNKSSLNKLLPEEKNNGTVIAKLKQVGKESAVETDTTASGNRKIELIESPTSDVVKVYLTLTEDDYDSKIKIGIYNLLGKKVRDLYDDLPIQGRYPYEIYTNELPKGIYICNVIGKNFRLDAKFIVSR